jgi:hypothetical protein
MICTVHGILTEWSDKEGKVRKAYTVNWKDEKCMQRFDWETQRPRQRSEIDIKIIVKKRCVLMWTGFSGLGTGSLADLSTMV